MIQQLSLIFNNKLFTQKDFRYMHQLRHYKNNTETLPSLTRDQYIKYAINQRDSKTPEIKSKTPKKNIKNKKTPKKDQNRQAGKKESLQTLASQLNKHSQLMSQKDEPTLCQTNRIKHQDLTCAQCQKYQSQINQLQIKITMQTKLNDEFQQKYNQLKQSYEKKLKKYKLKSKMQRDELKLLKWILEQRKEFSQILEQLQIYKDNNVLEKLQNQEVKMIDQRKTIKPKIRQDQKDQSRENITIIEQKNQSITSQKHQQYSSASKDHNPLKESHRITSRQQSLLEEEINILQQKVMQLSIKNEFLQKLKLKPQPQLSSPPVYDNNSISFSQQVNQDERKSFRNLEQNDFRQKQIPLHSYSQNQRQPYHTRPYQYSDDEESLSKEKENKYSYRGFAKQQNCWNVKSKHLNKIDQKKERNIEIDEIVQQFSGKKRAEVESRFVSPLKERFTEQNARESSKKKSQVHEEKVHIEIPQSRSKYCDSIKERSRLLGL